MHVIPAADAKLRFGYLMDTALQEPVIIERRGRPTTVMLSYAEYTRLISGKKAQTWEEMKAEAMNRPVTISVEEQERYKETLDDWEAISECEGLYLDDDMREDLQFIIDGRMSTDEFREYIALKIKSLASDKNKKL